MNTNGNGIATAKELDALKLEEYFVTETVFDPHVPVEEVTSFLRERKTTGKITTEYNMSQGGKQTIKVVERTKLNDAQVSKIRQLLGWD